MNRRNALAVLAATTASLPAFPSTSLFWPQHKNGAGQPQTPVIYASQVGVKLDSDVLVGGGSDDTAILQGILDKAPEMGGLHLIIDGAARISGLIIHSNTTIQCLNKSCGFFLSAQSNCALLKNHNTVFLGDIKDKNITLIGGTYNHNCTEQVHHLENKNDGKGVFGTDKWVIGMEFYGVENLTIRDITIRDQRTFAMLVANWKYVNMENILIDLQHHMWAQNQDGIHFWGPGEFLTMRNITGNSGDDFLALAPDENDHISTIRNVLIDGIFLDGADQGIRLLSRAEGRLDQVTIKNVMGSYKSFGFYIDHWFDGDGGDYGSILIDNVNLKQLAPNYHYTDPFLFRIAGKFQSLTLKNIVHHNPADSRSIIEIGWPKPDINHKFSSTHIKSLVIDGIQILEDSLKTTNASFIKVNTVVDNLVVRNVEIIKYNQDLAQGQLIEVYEEGRIKTLFMYNIYMNYVNCLVLNKGAVELMQLSNIIGHKMGDSFVQLVGGEIKELNEAGVNQFP